MPSSSQDAQRRQADAATIAAALDAARSSGDDRARQLATARQAVEAQAARIRLLETQLGAADARAGEAAARIEELQVWATRAGG